MEVATIIFAKSVALLFGAMSPGPSFIFTMRTTLSKGTASGVSAALGIGLASVLLAVLALFGLHMILSSVPTLYVILKLAGACYLLYLAWQMWKGAGDDLSDHSTIGKGDISVWRSFWSAVLVQLSNPKTAVIYGSVFATFLPNEVGRALSIGIPVAVLGVETGWYLFVVLALSAAPTRKLYLGSKAAIDRIAGGIMGFLGARLLHSTTEN